MKFSQMFQSNLRPVGDDDHSWLVELHNDPLVLRNLTHPTPITIEQHMSWWAKICADPCELRLIFEVEGQRTGFTKFYSIDTVNKNCVLGADIHVSQRGKGLSKHMWDAMLHHAFTTLNLHRVSLTTAAYNEIARRTYTRVGFRQEGCLVQSLYRDGQYHDQVCMYALQDDWLKQPHGVNDV